MTSPRPSALPAVAVILGAAVPATAAPAGTAAPASTCRQATASLPGAGVRARPSLCVVILPVAAQPAAATATGTYSVFVSATGHEVRDTAVTVTVRPAATESAKRTNCHVTRTGECLLSLVTVRRPARVQIHVTPGMAATSPVIITAIAAAPKANPATATTVIQPPPATAAAAAPAPAATAAITSAPSPAVTSPQATTATPAPVFAVATPAATPTPTPQPTTEPAAATASPADRWPRLTRVQTIALQAAGILAAFGLGWLTRRRRRLAATPPATTSAARRTCQAAAPATRLTQVRRARPPAAGEATELRSGSRGRNKDAGTGWRFWRLRRLPFIQHRTAPGGGESRTASHDATRPPAPAAPPAE
jgi:hypothetical protein